MKNNPHARAVFFLIDFRELLRYRGGMNMDLIPPHATCVFKGVIFEVWQWEQEMFDGTTETFERLKRCDSVDVVAVFGDKILIQEQEQPAEPKPFISLPGGRADKGGEPLEEAKRELLEETGATSDDWTLWQEAAPSSYAIFIHYVYIARNCKFTAEPKLDAGEKIKTDLVRFEDFLSCAENPSFRASHEVIKALLRMRIYPKEKEAFRNLLFKK